MFLRLEFDIILSYSLQKNGKFFKFRPKYLSLAKILIGGMNSYFNLVSFF